MTERELPRRHRVSRVIITAVGVALLPALWIGIKWGFDVPDRFLPSIGRVIEASYTLEPSVFDHALVTYMRTVLGLVSGTVFGIGMGMALWMSGTLERLLLPSFQTLRIVPPIAAIPFFLLWFGFSEAGKILLVIATIGFNLAVATHQALQSSPSP